MNRKVGRSNYMKVNNKKVLDTNKQKYGWFANSDILGSYDFYTTIISLDSVESSDLESVKSDEVHLKKVRTKKEKLRLGTYHKLRKVNPLAHHEYTHFIDSTSTLWGMRYLFEMKEAYLQNTKKYKSVETEFYKSALFYNKVRSFRLPSYYTELGTAQNKRPWRYKETSGNRFSIDGSVSDHPIFFVHFRNCNDDFLVRSPLSMISILESSAMAQELINNLNLIQCLPSDIKTVQASLYDNEIMSLVYDEKLTEYSVCCHLVSNDQKYAGVQNSLKACFLINRVILNFPSSAFSTLSKLENLEDILSIYSEEYIERIRNGLRYQDHGTLFFMISKLLPSNSLESTPSIISGIDTALAQLGFSLTEIKAEAKKEMDEVYKNLKALPTSLIDVIATSGKKNFQLIDWSHVRLPFEKLELPRCCLGDLNEAIVLSKVDSPIGKLKLDDVFDELSDGNIWVEKLNEACI
ncbi:hypothetical protein [Aliivibrio fischeri]|uniref:hypothetical protein n=1 Tax=Aliivibrio fischeri TaxID=668 RepID=UPI0007C54455|nr:hypothetical protein [Aliivibrio fischeri]